MRETSTLFEHEADRQSNVDSVCKHQETQTCEEEEGKKKAYLSVMASASEYWYIKTSLLVLTQQEMAEVKSHRLRSNQLSGKKK